MRIYLAVLLSMCGCMTAANASETKGDCADTPVSAVMELPAPLSDWATIVCTPYGHIISNQEGWIWTRPAGYSPVFIPSQMVRTAPRPVGNASHFTEVAFADATGSEGAKAAWQMLNSEFDESDVPEQAYRLHVTGSLGKSLVLYFFKLREQAHLWAIWCPGGECHADTRFMLLDMNAPVS